MSTIVEQELEVRAVVYDVEDDNTLLVKLTSTGRLYGGLSLGTNLTLRTSGGKTYLDAVASISDVLKLTPQAAAPADDASHDQIYTLTARPQEIFIKMRDGTIFNIQLSYA